MDVISQLVYSLENAQASRTRLLLGYNHCCHVSHLGAGFMLFWLLLPRLTLGPSDQLQNRYLAYMWGPRLWV